MSEFNQQKYIQDYNKKHYSTFKVNLLKDEKKELDDLLNKENLSQASFLRESIKEYFKPEAVIRVYSNKVEIWFTNHNDELVWQSTYDIKDGQISYQILYDIENLQSLGYKTIVINKN